jgi:hypothetical protein
MPHVRQQVRNAIHAACAASGAVAAESVYKSRVHKFDAKQVPAIVVYGRGERIEDGTPGRQQPKVQRRWIRTHVYVGVTANENLEDELDALGLTVENKVFEDPTLGGLAQETRLTSTDTDLSAGADKGFGVLLMVFETLVLTLEGKAEQKI